jgi:hypothetical protein
MVQNDDDDDDDDDKDLLYSPCKCIFIVHSDQ